MVTLSFKFVQHNYIRPSMLYDIICLDVKYHILTLSLSTTFSGLWLYHLTSPTSPNFWNTSKRTILIILSIIAMTVIIFIIIIIINRSIKNISSSIVFFYILVLYSFRNKQNLHLHFGPNHWFIHSWNLSLFVSLFIFSGQSFKCVKSNAKSKLQHPKLYGLLVPSLHSDLMVFVLQN